MGVLCVFFWLVASWQGHWLRPTILPSLKCGHLAVIGMRISSNGCGYQTPASVEVKWVICQCVTSVSQEGDVFHPDLPFWPTCSILGHHRQLWPLPLWTILCLWLSLQLFSFLCGKQNSKSRASETAGQGPRVQLSGLHSWVSVVRFPPCRHSQLPLLMPHSVPLSVKAQVPLLYHDGYSINDICCT